MPQGDFHAADAVNRWIASGGTTQHRHRCVGNKTQVHEMVPDGIRQIKSFQDAALSHLQFAQDAHRDSQGPLKRRQKETTTIKVGFQYTANRPMAANSGFR